MNLPDLERRILDLHGRLSFRPSVEAAARIGELLGEAKTTLPHGEFLPWVRRLGIGVRNAQLYMQVSTHAGNANPGSHLTIKQFLGLVRAARSAARRQERQELLDAVPDVPAGRLCRVVAADCRTYRWPAGIDCVATDPPWSDRPAYLWLARFAAGRLREGGLLLVQCGTADLPDRVSLLRAGGLRYLWTLALVYANVRLDAAAHHAWHACWRPVLVFCRGRQPPLKGVIDTVTVGPSDQGLHQWQQPLLPWVRWLGDLTRPGQLICDPFAGSATVGVAVKQIGGGRRYIGTEIDARHVRAARARIAAAAVP